jgi:hypothetical protein
MALGKSLSDIDNKLTYVIGYRNLYNIAVLFVALMVSFAANPLVQALSIVIVVLGLKWLLTQIRENLDVVYINEMASKELATLNTVVTNGK